MNFGSTLLANASKEVSSSLNYSADTLSKSLSTISEKLGHDVTIATEKLGDRMIIASERIGPDIGRYMLYETTKLLIDSRPIKWISASLSFCLIAIGISFLAPLLGSVTLSQVVYFHQFMARKARYYTVFIISFINLILSNIQKKCFQHPGIHFYTNRIWFLLDIYNTLLFFSLSNEPLRFIADDSHDNIYGFHFS